MVVMNGVLRGRWSAPQTTELLSELSCWLLGVGSKNSRFWITDWPERYQEIGNKGSLDWGSLRCLLSASQDDTNDKNDDDYTNICFRFAEVNTHHKIKMVSEFCFPVLKKIS